MTAKIQLLCRSHISKSTKISDLSLCEMDDWFSFEKSLNYPSSLLLLFMKCA